MRKLSSVLDQDLAGGRVDSVPLRRDPWLAVPLEHSDSLPDFGPRAGLPELIELECNVQANLRCDTQIMRYKQHGQIHLRTNLVKQLKDLRLYRNI